MPENIKEPIPPVEEKKQELPPREEDFSQDIYSNSQYDPNFNPDAKTPAAIASEIISGTGSAGRKAGVYWEEEPQPAATPRPLPEPAPARRPRPVKKPEPAQPAHINGQTWKNRRKRSRRDMITLNNGEPLSFAIRKVVAELLVVVLCAGLVLGFFFGREFLLDKLTNNTVGSLSTSSSYKERQYVKLTSQVTSKGNYACIDMLSQWAGTPADTKKLLSDNGGRDITGLSGGMEKELLKALPTKNITKRENLSNHDLIIDIYNSLKLGNPVLVAVADPEDTGISYAVVTTISSAKEALAMLDTDGKRQVLSFKEFIEASRYKGVDDFSLRLSLAFGLQNKNTAFFFTDKED